MIHFKIDTAYIELYKLLKACSLVASGGEAKVCIAEGYVTLNGQVETRKRCKLKAGDRVEFEGKVIMLEQA